MFPGRAPDTATFLREAVRRYASELDVLTGVDEGIADIEAGRYTLISRDAGLERFGAELFDRIDELERQRATRE